LGARGQSFFKCFHLLQNLDQRLKSDLHKGQQQVIYTVSRVMKTLS
jgi:hypothetical protein